MKWTNRALIGTLCLYMQTAAFAEIAAEWGGVIEIEASHNDDGSDLNVATAELGINAPISEIVSAELVLLYEEGETDFGVDTATVSLAPRGEMPIFKLGRFVVPYGFFATSLVSDPLTLEMGETSETAVQVEYVQGPLTTLLYVYNGDNGRSSEEDTGDIDNYGLTWVLDWEEKGLSILLGYMNDIGESDALQDGIADSLGNNATDDPVPGLSLGAVSTWEAWTLIAEYLAAKSKFADGELDFEGGGAKPAAMNLEADYEFDLRGKAAIAAIAYQATREAESLGLPETRVGLALTLGILEHTALAFEVLRERTYDDETANTLTAQLAVEF